MLKDIVVRSQLMMGKRAVFRPGWDSHGLPIELPVEKELGPKARELSASRLPRPLREARDEVRRRHAHRVQAARLLGNWDDPYLTLSKDYEAAIARQLAGFARAGLVYRGKKPVHWCLTHHTALAEAEVEYEDHASPTIYVRFPVVGDLGKADARLRRRRRRSSSGRRPLDAAGQPGDRRQPGVRLRGDPARRRIPDRRGRAGGGLPGGHRHRRAEGVLDRDPRDGLRALEGTRYAPPFPRPSADGDKDYRLWFARHATLEAGTGLVHTAPGHGADDYLVGRDHGLTIFAPVDENGRFTAEVELGELNGAKVFDANPKIVEGLAARGLLLNKRARRSSTSTPAAGAARNRSSSARRCSGSPVSKRRTTRNR